MSVALSVILSGLSSVIIEPLPPIATGLSLLPTTVIETVAFCEVLFAAEELSVAVYVKLVACEKLELRLSKGVKVTTELVEEPLVKVVPVALSVSVPC